MDELNFRHDVCIYLKYCCASGRELSGSLASDHMTTAALFLSLDMSSSNTLR